MTKGGLFAAGIILGYLLVGLEIGVEKRPAREPLRCATNEEVDTLVKTLKRGKFVFYTPPRSDTDSVARPTQH